MNGFIRPRFAPTYVGYVLSARDISSPSPPLGRGRGSGRGRGEGESLFQSWKSLLSPALSSMGWRRGRRGTLNSYYAGDYLPDSRDCWSSLTFRPGRRGGLGDETQPFLDQNLSSLFPKTGARYVVVALETVPVDPREDVAERIV